MYVVCLKLLLISAIRPSLPVDHPSCKPSAFSTLVQGHHWLSYNCNSQQQPIISCKQANCCQTQVNKSENHCKHNEHVIILVC